jgi:hypothetical protein
MKREYFLNAMRMLQSQLREEEENYQIALKSEKEFAELKQIKQRMKSIKEFLLSMESKKDTYLKQNRESFALEVW